jgi:queuine/archaeosine tRNA-ribosyltransferase
MTRDEVMAEVKRVREALEQVVATNGGAVTVNVSVVAGGAEVTRDEVCTCAQYSQCPVCNKSRSNYAELMKENERLRSALEACDHLARILQMALKEVTP